MSIELIYKTTSPKAIAWWEMYLVKEAEQRDLRTAFRDEMLALYGPSDKRVYGDEKPGRLLWSRGEYIIGLDSGYNEQPPAGSGWRLDSKDRVWMPKLATAEGKALRDRMNGLTLWSRRAHMPEIGIPQMAFGDSHIYRGGVEFDAEPEPTLYQVWGGGAASKDCLAEQANVPEVVWVEVPRSEWYARVERIEAQAAATSVVPTPDLECIQPDATERDKWGFGE